jgi:FkbH-like protein
LVYFIDDLLSEKFYSPDILEETLSPSLALLEKAIQISTKPVIASISPGQNFDTVRYAKGAHYLQKAFNWMLDKFEVLANKYQHFYILDLKEAFGEAGSSKAFDNRNWCFSHCRLSPLGIRVIASNVAKIFERHYAPASKVLVLDCDNTIWGGVIGEDNLDGIVLGQDGIGQMFVDFQKEVKALINQGIIVVLSSKNNESEVWEVFDQHDAMILTKDDIVAWRINWNEKSQGVKEMAAELDLDINSFVFWDDNPVERDKMKVMAPSVTTINVPKEVYEWPNLLKGLFSLAKFNVTADDNKKTELYHKRAKFVRESSESDDEVQYLKSIKLVPKHHKFDQSNIKRAVQLCSKTNQFNLRTIRHSAEDLIGMSDNNIDLCFLVSLEDVYGSHGIVGLVCLQKIDKNTAFIDTFLMSCRVLGRHLESWMLRQAINRCMAQEIKVLIGGYVESERNAVASSFFIDHGFNRLDPDSDPLLISMSFNKDEVLYKIPTTIQNLPFEDIYA